MAYAPPDPNTDPVPTPGSPPGDSDSSEDPKALLHPRLIEEHHVIGPHGEDEIEATDERGRRWYQLRPEPWRVARRREEVLQSPLDRDAVGNTLSRALEASDVALGGVRSPRASTLGSNR